MQFGASSPAATPEVDRQSGGAQAPAAKPSRVHSNTGSVQSSTGSSDGYFDSRPSSSIVTPRLADPVLSQGAGKAVTGPGAFGLGPAMGEPLAAPTAASNSPHDEGDDGDDSDEGSPDGSEGTSSLNHGSPAVPLPSQPTAAAASRSDTSQRPSFYSRTSQSMVNLSNVTSQPDGQIDADIARREDKASVAPQLETIRSREVAPRSIVLPPRTMAMANGMLSPNSEWTKAPPTPAVGLVNSIWGKSKAEETKPAPKRRRSADDLLAPPPAYEPPWPGVIIPRPRDEEGKEKLPTYWCAVSAIVRSGNCTDRHRCTSRELSRVKWSSLRRAYKPAIEVGKSSIASSTAPIF